LNSQRQVAESGVVLGIDADNSGKTFDPIFERAKDEEWRGARI
jgi:hypothetical protein